VLGATIDFHEVAVLVIVDTKDDEEVRLERLLTAQTSSHRSPAVGLGLDSDDFPSALALVDFKVDDGLRDGEGVIEKCCRWLSTSSANTVISNQSFANWA
jgi:hypothetical protein